MRSPLILYPLILAVLGWTASGHAAPQMREKGLTVQQQETSREKPQGLESPEVDWQVIALRRKGVDTCPGVLGWISDKSWLVQTLRPPHKIDTYRKDSFDARSDRKLKEELRRAIKAEPLLKELDRFCVYRKESSSTPDFPIHPLPVGLEGVANSRAALVPAGELDTGVSASILAQHFLDQTSGMSQAQKAALAGPRLVRLVFIDTQPDGEGLPSISGPSRHGYTLVHQAHQLVCSDVSPCPVEFATRLALPHANRDLPSAGNPPAAQGATWAWWTSSPRRSCGRSGAGGSRARRGTWSSISRSAGTSSPSTRISGRSTSLTVEGSRISGLTHSSFTKHSSSLAAAARW